MNGIMSRSRLALWLIAVSACGPRVVHTAASGHVTIAGQIVDELTGDPLAGVLVEVREAGPSLPSEVEPLLEVFADETGRFVFSGLLPATYRLTFQFIGYRTSVVTMVIGEESPDELRVELSPIYVRPPAETAALLQELRTQRRRWSDRRPRAYKMRYRWSCFCPGTGTEVRVEVEGSEVSERELVVGRYGLDEEGQGWTVGDLFRRIESAIRNPRQTVEVEYDPDRGFPRRIRTTFGFITDSDFTVEVLQFEPLR